MPTDLYREHLDTLLQRAEAALQRGGFDHLVIPSGCLHLQAFDDLPYPFVANPQFKAWLPLTDAPGCWLVITPGQRPHLLFLQPQDYWHAVPELPAGGWTAHWAVSVLRAPEDAARHLPPDPARCAILGEPQAALGDYVPNNPPAVLQYLDYHRAYKTAYELEQLWQANRIAVRAHRAAERAFRAGASEFGIHLAYCQAAGQDANDLPYGNIVALNQHAAVLHYTARDRLPPRPARSLLIDAGASHAGYAADVTRTYAAEDGDFAALVRAVDAVQQQLCAQVRAGTDYRALHLQAHLLLAGVLREAGVVRISPEAAVAEGVTAAFFPHGLGHGIGLQVHDVAGLAASDAGGTLPRPDGHPWLRLTRPLAPGMVVTIEPGLYFIDLLLEQLRAHGAGNAVDWARVEALRPYGGIRIEDDVACTADAPRNLTREAFAAA